MTFEDLKKDIILKDGIYYFDFTASGLACKSVEEQISSILLTYANTHSECSSCARTTTQHYEKARRELKKLLELNDEFYLMPCGYGSSGAMKKFQELLGIYIPPMLRNRLNLKNSDIKNIPLFIVGPYEHHSNEVSARLALCECVRIKFDNNKNVDMNMLEDVLKKNQNREIIASFNVASNVTGIFSNYKEIYRLVKKYNGILALDSSTYSPYGNLDCNFYDAMFLSPHKLIGGIGSSGLLIIKKELCKSNLPTFAGGGTVSYVSRISQSFTHDKEQLEQGGTPGIIQLIRAHLAYRIRNQLGFENIKNKELELKSYFEPKFESIKNIITYYPKNQSRLPIYSFNFKDKSPYDITEILSNKFGIQARAGCACAGPYGHDLLNLQDDGYFKERPGFVRIGLHYTHNKDDLDYLLGALNDISNY